MKQLVVLSVLALAACGKADKFRYPVVVTAETAAIYMQPDTSAYTRILVVKRGDTLDLKSAAVNGLYTVAPKPGGELFPKHSAKGFIDSRFVQVPDSTLRASEDPRFPRGGKAAQ
ncbi:hypothetical protein J0X19_03445 [Hymenobacter sp. BT186]|uniref:Uncharacterized protein n=1 Tax=Hymenobacter telluris TaxID=2816474 RepID=A0A939ET57_9BACT|nr:hypothetical protein [Hymenobacter telluris]MBO0356988.1 hypothetical protein [Hymenobacter telluris]MBW3373015.1 hypothetical protein [Hymenobacter norwichensis]